MGSHAQHLRRAFSRDGITVEQAFSEDRFNVPTVTLAIHSDRPHTADIRLVVSIPDGLTVDEVGLHPDYLRDRWRVNGRRLTFETPIDPDEEVTTMYAIESIPVAYVDRLLDSLRVRLIDEDATDRSALRRDDTRSGSDEAAERTMRSTASAGVTDAESEPSEGTTDDPTADPPGSAPISVDEEMITLDPGTETGQPNQTSADGERSTAALIAELRDRARSGELSTRTKWRLRVLLSDVERDARFFEELRIAALRQRLDNVEAILDWIREVDERPGGSKDLWDEVEHTVLYLTRHIDVIEDEGVSSDDRHESVTHELDAMEAEVTEIERFVTVALGELDQTLDTEDSRLPSIRSILDARLDRVNDRLDSVDTEIEDIKRDLEAVNGEVSSLIDSRETLRDEWGSL